MHLVCSLSALALLIQEALSIESCCHSSSARPWRWAPRSCCHSIGRRKGGSESDCESWSTFAEHFSRTFDASCNSKMENNFVLNHNNGYGIDLHVHMRARLRRSNSSALQTARLKAEQSPKRFKIFECVQCMQGGQDLCPTHHNASSHRKIVYAS
jgi:hypothetical protein